MGHQLSVHLEDHLVIYVYEGEVTFEELKQAREEMLALPELNDFRYGVCDFRNATKKISPEELQKLSEEIKKNPTSIRWCLLNSTPKETGLSSLFIHQLNDTSRMETFSTVKGASSFLGIDLERFLK